MNEKRIYKIGYLILSVVGLLIIMCHSTILANCSFPISPKEFINIEKAVYKICAKYIPIHEAVVQEPQFGNKGNVKIIVNIYREKARYGIKHEAPGTCDYNFPNTIIFHDGKSQKEFSHRKIRDNDYVFKVKSRKELKVPAWEFKKYRLIIYVSFRRKAEIKLLVSGIDLANKIELSEKEKEFARGINEKINNMLLDSF